MRRRDLLQVGIGLGLGASGLMPAWAQQGRARWLVGETPLARIFCESGPEAMGNVARGIHNVDWLLRYLTRATLPAPSTKLDAYFVGWTPSLAEALGRSAGTTAGFYTRSPEHTAIVAYAEERDNLPISPFDILRHEYTHHFMYYHAPGVYPTWYQEGFAELIGAVREQEDGRFLVGRVNRLRASWLLNEDLIPLARMLTTPLSEFSEDERAQFYAQSWLLAHFIQFDAERQVAFSRYIDLLRDGGNFARSFETAFETTLADADIALARYRGAALPALYVDRDQAADPPALTMGESLSEAANALLMLEVRLRSADERDMPSILDDVRERTRRYRGDPLADMQLARAEARFGDPAAARALLEPILASAPEEPDALYLMGQSHLRAAVADRATAAENARAARRFFIAANAARPDHYPTLFRYAQADILMRVAVTPQTLDVLVRAHDLAPQVGEIALFTASMLLEAGRTQEAAVAARLVAFSPHGGSLAQEGQAIWRRAQAALGQQG